MQSKKEKWMNQLTRLTCQDTDTTLGELSVPSSEKQSIEIAAPHVK